MGRLILPIQLILVYMKKIAMCFALFIFGAIIQAQEAKNNKYSNWGFKISTFTRLNPIYLGNEPDQQLNGIGIEAGTYYVIDKLKVELIFEQSIRYDVIYFDKRLISPQQNQINNPINGLIIDYNFSVEKFFNLKNDMRLNIGGGLAAMNTGTDYSYTRHIFDTPSGPVYSTTSASFSFSAFHVYMGIDKEFNYLSIGAYISDSHQYSRDLDFMLIYLKIGHKFRKKTS